MAVDFEQVLDSAWWDACFATTLETNTPSRDWATTLETNSQGLVWKQEGYVRGSWHRYERSKNVNQFPEHHGQGARIACRVHLRPQLNRK